MSDSDQHYQEWRKLVESQINSAQDAVKLMLVQSPPADVKFTDFRQSQIRKVNAELRALKMLLGGRSVPQQITALENALENFSFNPRNSLDTVWSATDSLKKLTSSSVKVASFADIFEAHKESNEIVELIDSLVMTLNKVIDEGEEHYNSRLIKDLEKLLVRAKGLKQSKLYEVGAVAEVIGRIALELAGQKLGLPGASLLMDLAKTSAKLSSKVIDVMRDSQSEYIRLIELKTIDDNLELLPELNQLAIEKEEQKAVGN